jgi:DNA-binding beta-propeller fold protein YncE
VIKTISGLTSFCEFEYNPILDKIYTYDVNFFGNRLTYVIDCTTDSVIKVLQTTGSGWRYRGDIQFDSLTNKIYLTGENGLVVIDCTQDSVIKRVPSINGGAIFFRTHGDRRVYVKDAMFDRFTDSLLGYLSFPIPSVSYPYAYNGINDQLYISKDTAPGGWLQRTRIYVVDCNTQTIIDTILVNFSGHSTPQNMIWNPLNNKLYFTPYSDSLNSMPLFVADCRTNQVVATFHQVDRVNRLFEVHSFDASINRLYVNCDGESRLGMIRDNITGIEEIKKKPGEFKVYPSLGTRFFIETGGIKSFKIYNVLGEKVFEISTDNKDKIVWEGKNKDGIKLSRGIYFIIPDPETRTVKKLILF